MRHRAFNALSYSISILLILLLEVYGLPQGLEVQTEFPLEDRTETVTEAGDFHNDEEDSDEILMDMMDRYVEVPYITGNLSCQCGMPPSRLIGGEGAMINEYPWTGLLYAVEAPNFKIPYCGATLINNRYLLTASHCVDGMAPSKIEVVLREQNISSNTDEFMHLMGRHGLSALKIEVDRYILHPNYSRLTLDNDIALIRLKVRLPLEDFPVAPICVPTQEASFSQGLYATVAGYGATSEPEAGRKPAKMLQTSEVRVLSNELCNTAPYHHGRVSMNMLCADGNGKGPCSGDTGGGLMMRYSRDSTRKVLAGIASWSTSCADMTRPAVYTRVPRYEPWIRSNTRDAFWCSN